MRFGDNPKPLNNDIENKSISKETKETDLSYEISQKSEAQKYEEAENNFIKSFEEGNIQINGPDGKLIELNLDEINIDKILQYGSDGIYSVNVNKSHSNFPDAIVNGKGELILYIANIDNHKHYKEALNNTGIVEKKEGINYKYYKGDNEIKLEEAYGEINKEIYKLNYQSEELMTHLNKTIKTYENQLGLKIKHTITKESINNIIEQQSNLFFLSENSNAIDKYLQEEIYDKAFDLSKEEIYKLRDKFNI